MHVFSRWVLVVTVAFLLVLGLAGAASAQVLEGAITDPYTDATAVAPWIATDLPDYPPGGQVNVIGGGWQGNSSVAIVVNDDAGSTWRLEDTVPVADDGSIEYAFRLPDWFVAAYTLRASGDVSGTAEVVFADSAGSYTVKWYAADPAPNKGPYKPTYKKYKPTSPGAPAPQLGGRADNPYEHAVAYASPAVPSNLDAVTSLAPKNMALGQIVPFEIEITVSGSTAPENGVISFVGQWDTRTTSGTNFGYDPAYKVYAAFVDYGDPGTYDPENDATVSSVASTVLNAGTPNETIEGHFEVSGLDTGDRVIVEVWLVLKDELPDKATGNVQSRLVSARTATGDTINTGNQTVPLLRVQEFVTQQADVSVVKDDDPDPVYGGDELTYTLRVTNTSTDTVANGVVVSDTIDPRTTFVQGSVRVSGAPFYTGDATFDPDTRTLTVKLGALEYGATATITFTVIVADVDPRTGEADAPDRTNTVEVTALTADPVPGNNRDTEYTGVIPAGYYVLALSVDKRVDADGDKEFNDPEALDEPGGPVTYSVTVRNESVWQAVEVYELTDDVYGDLTGKVVDADGNPVTFPYRLEKMDDPGDSVTWYFTEDVAADAANEKLTDVVTARAYQAGVPGNWVEASDDATVTFADVMPAITLDKAAEPASLDEPGGTFTYRYTVTNDSVEPVKLTLVRDSVIGTIYEWAEGDEAIWLQPGESTTFTGEWAYGDAGSYENTAWAYAVDNEGNEASDDDSATVTVADVMPAVEVVKTADVTEVPTTGGWVTYTFTVTNMSVEDVTVTSLVDDKFGDLASHAGLPRTLAAGESFSFDLRKWIEGEAGDHVNVATVSAKDNEGNEARDDDDATVTIRKVSVDIEKEVSVDGGKTWTDADSATGPEVLAGEPVLFRYVVTNDGTADLSGVKVEDKTLGFVFDIGDLAAGESVTLSPDGNPYSAEKGQHRNTATATGEWKGNEASDSDDAHYFGADASLDVEKATNGEDADEPTGPYVKVGDPVTWTIVVTNTGNVSLQDVVVADDKVAALDPVDKGNGDEYLDPGETWTYEATGSAEPGQYENQASATGSYYDDAGNIAQPTDSDLSHYYGAAPDIAIDKTTEGCDGTWGDGVYVKAGETVTWKYVVTNTGNVTLTDVAVTDDEVGAIGTVASLKPGDSVTFTAGGTAVAGDYDNVATATGASPVGEVSASDGSSYFGYVVAIDVEKYVRVSDGEWLDADSPTGPYAIVGKDEVSFKFVVENTGNVTLTDIKLTDDTLDLSGATIPATLAAGESFTVTIGPLPAEYGQHVDTATAKGCFTACGASASDSDMAHYYGWYNALTPGYWKNHPESWEPTPYRPDMLVGDVFAIPTAIDREVRKKSIELSTRTLMDALAFKGGPKLNGAAQILLRAGVAAILNATHPSTTYPYTDSEIIAKVNEALATLDRATILTLAKELDMYNNGAHLL